MRLLLLLLLVSAVSCRMNACGSDVSKYTNYLNIKVNVPIDQVADMMITPHASLPRQFQDLMDGEAYQAFLTGQRATTGGIIGDWTVFSDDIRRRTNIYQASSNGIPIDSYSTQTVDDKKQMAEMVIRSTGHTSLGSFEITTVTCVAPGTIYQVDVTFAHHMDRGVIGGSYNPGYIGVPSGYNAGPSKSAQFEEGMRTAMSKLHSAMGDLLKKMETRHQNYPYEPVFGQNYKRGMIGE